MTNENSLKGREVDPDRLVALTHTNRERPTHESENSRSAEAGLRVAAGRAQDQSHGDSFWPACGAELHIGAGNQLWVCAACASGRRKPRTCTNGATACDCMDGPGRAVFSAWISCRSWVSISSIRSSCVISRLHLGGVLAATTCLFKPLRLEKLQLPNAGLWDKFAPLGYGSTSDPQQVRESRSAPREVDCISRLHAQHFSRLKFWPQVS